MEYKNVDNHAHEVAGGRMIGPGETVELTDEQVREGLMEDLIAQGKLLGIDEQAEHEASLAKRRVNRREAETNDEEDQ